MTLTSRQFVHLARTTAVFLVLTLVVVTTSSAEAIIIRHDVHDAEYLPGPDAYPAVFDIFKQRGGVATLVSPGWALTVGHVGQDVQPGHEVTINGQSYGVKQVILHPEWETNRLEMSLLELDRPVEGVAPIPPHENGDELGQIVTFVGRGDTGTGLTGPTTQDHQLRAATNRVERVEGGTLIFRFDAPGDENVTPLEGISGPGDSGGPALIETPDGPRVAGLSVASSGRPKGRYGALEFYSRVSPQVDWIRAITSPEGVNEPAVHTSSASNGDEADVVVTPIPAPASNAESVPSDGPRSVVYWAIAALGGLVVAVFAWWSRRRRLHRSA
jgi:hypothetical protein